MLDILSERQTEYSMQHCTASSKRRATILLLGGLEGVGSAKLALMNELLRLH